MSEEIRRWRAVRDSDRTVLNEWVDTERVPLTWHPPQPIVGGYHIELVPERPAPPRPDKIRIQGSWVKAGAARWWWCPYWWTYFEDEYPEDVELCQRFRFHPGRHRF